MNEKEALEIVDAKDGLIRCDCLTKNAHSGFHEAKGYLEAIEKAKVLEEALQYSCSHSSLHCDGSCERDVRQQALAKWEKEK